MTRTLSSRLGIWVTDSLVSKYIINLSVADIF